MRELDKLLLLRPLAKADRGFVASTWVQSYKQAGVPNGFLGRHAEVVDCLLARATTLVLCDREDAESLHGWVCGSGCVLHYVYVPHELRRNRFARQMIAAAIKGYPNTIPCSHKWPHQSSRFQFNPYLACLPENDNGA